VRGPNQKLEVVLRTRSTSRKPVSTSTAVPRSSRYAFGVRNCSTRKTRARVRKGETRYPHKIINVFETHTEAMHGGRRPSPWSAAKRRRFKKWKISSSVATQYVPSAWPDQVLWGPSLERHEEMFARPSRLPTGDGGSRRRPRNKW